MRQKLWLVTLLLCATIYAQGFALETEHQQHNPNQHCCLLCHAGPLALVQPELRALIAPLFRVVSLAYSPEFVQTRGLFLLFATSRAPPAPAGC